MLDLSIETWALSLTGGLLISRAGMCPTPAPAVAPLALQALIFLAGIAVALLALRHWA